MISYNQLPKFLLIKNFSLANTPASNKNTLIRKNITLNTPPASAESVRFERSIDKAVQNETSNTIDSNALVLPERAHNLKESDVSQNISAAKSLNLLNLQKNLLNTFRLFSFKVEFSKPPGTPDISNGNNKQSDPIMPIDEEKPISSATRKDFSLELTYNPKISDPESFSIGTNFDITNSVGNSHTTPQNYYNNIINSKRELTVQTLNFIA